MASPSPPKPWERGGGGGATSASVGEHSMLWYPDVSDEILILDGRTSECGEHDFNTYSHNDRDIYIIF